MVLSLWLLACVPKHTAVVSSTPIATDVVVVQDQLDQRTVASGPTALVTGVSDLLGKHGLNAMPVAPESWVEAFGARRTESQRLAWMTERTGASPAILLIETRAEFYSQMNGRYRWTVEVRSSLRSTAHPEQLASDSFSVPVFLDFDHEREEAAIAAAIPVIQHHLDVMVDAWLGGQNP